MTAQPALSAEHTPDILYKAEWDFAISRGLAIDTLDAIRDIRKTQKPPTPWHRIAVWIVAPVLAGFMQWIDQQAKGYENPQILGVMREGRLLCRLMKALFNIPAQEIWLNRNLSMLGAFGAGDDEALINWLVRTRLKPLTQTEAIQKLLDRHDGSDEILETESAYKMLGEWEESGDLVEARSRANAIAGRALKHWDKTVAPRGTVLLMDFACAGNIQRSIQTILKAQRRETPIMGLNFLTTSGSIWAEKADCTMHGCLAERGTPEWLAEAYARTPDLMEIFTTAPVGSLEDYTEGGEAVCGKSFLSTEQRKLIEDLQNHIVAAAKLYHQKLGERLIGDAGRVLWGRFLLQPLLAEVETLADWPLDAGLDGAARRTLAPRLSGEASAWTKMQSAWPAGSRLRVAEKA